MIIRGYKDFRTGMRLPTANQVHRNSQSEQQGPQTWDLAIIFCMILYVPVNSYGHVGTVSSPNHTFTVPI